MKGPIHAFLTLAAGAYLALCVLSFWLHSTVDVDGPGSKSIFSDLEIRQQWKVQ